MEVKKIIEINGVKYQKIEKETPKEYSRRMSAITIMASMEGMYNHGMSGGGNPERPNVDVVKEFELIENKQSKLSKSQREWVVSQFKKEFKKLES